MKTRKRKNTSPYYWRVDIRSKYDPAIHWERFESVETCNRKQRRRINALRRLVSKSEYTSWSTSAAGALLRDLEACKKNRRCGSMACAICMRRFRRWQVSEALYILKDENRETFRFMTLVLHGYIMEHGFDPTRVRSFRDGLMKRLQAQLPSGARLIGWIEVSWEPDMNGYMPHFHGICAGATYEELRALRPTYKVAYGKRPLIIKRIKKGTEMRLATYIVKQFPRGSTSRQKKAAPRLQDFNKSRSAARTSASMELKRLIGLAAFKPENLLVMRGVRRDGKRLRKIS